MKDWKDILVESSLTRVYEQSLIHDVGIITGYRYARDCNEGEVYLKSENKKRNSILSAKLLKMGYSLTRIEGAWVQNYKQEGEMHLKEKSLLVVDIEDKGTLRQDLVKLGIEFEQDSILYSKAGAKSAILISTNTCPKAYPGEGNIGVELKIGRAIFGKDGEFYSKVSGRPFVFESIDYVDNTYEKQSMISKQAITALSKLIL